PARASTSARAAGDRASPTCRRTGTASTREPTRRADTCRAIHGGRCSTGSPPAIWRTRVVTWGCAYYTGMRMAGALLLSVLLAAGAAAAPVGTMSDLMVRIIYPTSDAVFYIATRTPTTDAEWHDLEGKTLMLAESGNLLMMPGYARDDKRWMDDARLMLDAGTAAF